MQIRPEGWSACPVIKHLGSSDAGSRLGTREVCLRTLAGATNLPASLLYGPPVSLGSHVERAVEVTRFPDCSGRLASLKLSTRTPKVH